MASAARRRNHPQITRIPQKPDERRRRYDKVTPEGRRALVRQKATWESFVEAVRRVTEGEHA